MAPIAPQPAMPSPATSCCQAVSICCGFCANPATRRAIFFAAHGLKLVLFFWFDWLAPSRLRLEGPSSGEAQLANCPGCCPPPSKDALGMRTPRLTPCLCSLNALPSHPSLPLSNRGDANDQPRRQAAHPNVSSSQIAPVRGRFSMQRRLCATIHLVVM